MSHASATSHATRFTSASTSRSRKATSALNQPSSSSRPLSACSLHDSLSLPVLTASISVLSFCMASSPTWAFDGDAAAAFSSRGCVGCHSAGGNVVVPSATLFSKDLERNGLTSKADVSSIIELGKGKMPGYGEECAPKGACTFGPRIEAEEIDALASYVLERAQSERK